MSLGGRVFRKWLARTILLIVLVFFVCLQYASPFGDDYWPVIFDFIGSFHPIVLHLPIGLWFGVLALLATRLFIRDFVPESLIYGAAVLTFISAAVAFAAGLTLYLGGGYGRDSIVWHMYSSFAFLAALGIFVYIFGQKYRPFFCWVSALLTSFILIIAGHAGGVITHGEPMDRAPWKVFAAREMEEGLPKTMAGEEHLFADLVLPILEDKCISCHGAERAKGRLQMDSYLALLKGGSKGVALVPGDLTASLLIERLHLPLDHSERMPPAERSQLDSAELAFLEWWVASGLPEDQMVRDLVIPEEHQTYVNALIGDSPEAIEARALKVRSDTLMAAYGAVQAEFPGLLVQSVVKDTVFELSSSSMLGYDESAVQIALAPLAESLVRIDWNRRVLDETWVRLFALSKDLEILNLTDSDFSAEVLSFLLSEKSSLKKINLTGTAFCDEHIDHLLQNADIEMVVLTDTNLSESGFERLVVALPKTQLISSYSF